MTKTQKSEPLTIQSSDTKTREIETIVFSRRPFVGDLFRVTRTRTTFGPQLPIMAEDTLARETVLEAIADDALDRLRAQLEREIQNLKSPLFRAWLSRVSKKIGTQIGEPMTLSAKDEENLITLVRCAVGLDDLLRALDRGDKKEIARLRALYKNATSDQKKGSIK